MVLQADRAKPQALLPASAAAGFSWGTATVCARPAPSVWS